MSSLSPSPSNVLYNDTHQSIMQFLKPQDLLLNYAPVSRKYSAMVDLYYKAQVDTVEISSTVVNRLFADIQKFSKLKKLSIKGHDFQRLETPNGAGIIDHLSFGVDSRITSQQILMFLEAVPNLQALSLTRARSQRYFEPIEGARLSDAAKNNLKQLAELDLSFSHIDAQGLLEMLQNSTNFKSVDLSGLDGLSDAIFTELVRSKGLKCLTLDNIDPAERELNYGILASCTSLESFTPSHHISEEALISIIQANPNLKHLNLHNCPAAACTSRVLQILAAKTSLESFTTNWDISEEESIAIIRSNPNLTQLDLHCPIEVVTDRVLQTIGMHLPKLEKIKLIRMHNITDNGFLSLIQGCKKLCSIHLTQFSQLSTAALAELKNCRSLRELKIESSTLSDEFFDTLATMTDLTTLDIFYCTGVKPKSYSKIQSLVQLRYLNLIATNTIDPIIKGIIDQCLKLQTLKIGPVDELRSTRDVICTALREARTDLESLFISSRSYGENYKSVQEMEDQLMAEFSQLQSCYLLNII